MPYPVSVIIGAHNEEEHIDRCLENITGQTLRELEIILINDGSTDGTHSKCVQWASRDPRIVYINRRLGGIGPVRDYGITVARGRYVAFSDADDVRAADSIEKLYQAIVRSDADVAVHDFYRVEYDGESVRSRTMVKHWLFSEEIREDRDLILRGDVEYWAKLFKKSLFSHNEIQQPAHSGDAIASMPLVLACAKKIVHVREPLYCYRINNQNSATNRFTIAEAVLPTLDYIKTNFHNRGLDRQFAGQIKRITFKYAKNALYQAAQMKGQVDSSRYHKLKTGIYQHLERCYPAETAFWTGTRSVYGSYSLRATIQAAMVEPSQLRLHRQFSGVISMVSDKRDLLPHSFRHHNEYRNGMVLQDLHTNCFQDKAADTVYVDFLEERFDIGTIGNSCMTLSDAFLEGTFDGDYQVIDRHSALAQVLFEQACLQFIGDLKKKYPPSAVYLVKYRLADCYGGYGKEKSFGNAAEINKTNALIRECCDYFEHHFPGIHVIEIPDDDAFFSDEAFRHGCCPHHLNDYVYAKTAEKAEAAGLGSQKDV